MRWIIPAHAGFTNGYNGQNHYSRDHPRTRGVYLAWGVWYPRLGGSSPHTRGLHRAHQCRLADMRIIPAHAGFTYQGAELAVW